MSIKKIIFYSIISSIVLSGCEKSVQQKSVIKEESTLTKSETKQVPNNAEQILAKPEIPILCYHRISDNSKGDYTVSLKTFSEHLKILSDSGYHSIVPDQLYDYLVYNKTLPQKPFMITFDDSREEHSTIAAKEMEKYGFKGVFFIMTITYNKKNYMTTEQIAELAKNGHVVGLHSWDHTMATKYKDSLDWQKQVVLPKTKLQGITSKPVDFWAYPNGVFNHEAAGELSKYFKISFSLSTKRDSVLPLQSVRRMITTDCSGERLLKSMRRTFDKN